MTDFDAVRASGFHTDLIEKLVRQANEGDTPPINLFQLETTFSDESVFRHFDYLGLRGRLLTSIHVDELPVGIRWYMNLLPTSQISGVELGQFAHSPYQSAPVNGHEDAGDPALTVLISFGMTRSFEIEPMQCDDPTCTAEHGMAGVSKDEGLLMSFGSPESSTEEDAMEFVSSLAAALAHT